MGRITRQVLVQGTELLPSDPSRVYREKLARVTLDSMIQLVGLLDAEGTVLEINKVALDAVGIQLSDVEGRPLWTTFWWQVSEASNLELREAIRRAAKGELVRWDAEIYGRAGGKETIIVDASLCPVHDAEGRVVFICAEGRDITEKKAHEREIAQKNLELQALLQRIRELDEIKTQFFANVSHELRTPLALILGPAQRLLDDAGALSLADRRESAQVVARNARMLLKHVNDLLDMSRLEAGKLKIELQDVDVAALLRLLASQFAVLAADRGVALEVAAEATCVAAVDADKLQRVLMNLLGNAFKFTPVGGRIRCAVAAEGPELVFSVDDSGPGVPAEMRVAVFERFRQIDGGVSRKKSGTGLGLAIAKELVELHRGRIEVLDSPLGGACFRVTVPLHRLEAGLSPGGLADRAMVDAVVEELRFAEPPRPAAAGAAGAAGGTGEATSGKPRVLVVEDNPDMNRFVAQCLSRDYEVATAFDGREGIEQALRLLPSLIVSDIMMPNVSGVEMIAELRKLPALRQTPILLLSAKADDALIVQLLENGAQDYLVKPFSERELGVRVKNLVLAQQAHEQVSQLRDAAEAANRAKDEFLAMLGHELRNPLSPILSALQLMALRGDPGAERERVIIERQVHHLSGLVEDLLDVSRITRGGVELKMAPVELSDVVGRALEMVSPLVEERRHTLRVQVPAGLWLEGDRQRLAQVISNLLTNAAKYTAPGGEISVHAEATLRRNGEEELSLIVRDTGIGIAPDMLPRIFEMFVQERQEIDRTRGGLGIGLAIVRNLVERHGGTVTAHSEGLGKGAELRLRLPALAAERTAARRADGAVSSALMSSGALSAEHLGAPAGTTRDSDVVRIAELRERQQPQQQRATRVRVLVVDDNEDAAEMLGAMLIRRGYDAEVANDARGALQLAAATAPDVAILDIGLPVVDGYALAGQLLAMPGLAGLQLIALTGYGQESDRQRTRAAGFHHHLVKPVSLDTIEAVLPRRSARS